LVEKQTEKIRWFILAEPEKIFWVPNFPPTSFLSCHWLWESSRWRLFVTKREKSGTSKPMTVGWPLSNCFSFLHQTTKLFFLLLKKNRWRLSMRCV
jgi:hypothetical protein